MEQLPLPPDHPLLACAGRLHAAVDEASAADPVLMTTAQKAEALLELSRATDRLHGLVLRVLAVADDVALERWHRVRAGLLTGTVNLEQARVIARVLDALPADLEPEVRDRAEAHLVEQAAAFDPQRRGSWAAKVLEVVAPDVAEDHERRALEDEERRAPDHAADLPTARRRQHRDPRPRLRRRGRPAAHLPRGVREPPPGPRRRGRRSGERRPPAA